MITFDEEKKVFYLEGKGFTYAFGVTEKGLLQHLYFGAPVGRDLAVPVGEYRFGSSHMVRENLPLELHTPLSGDYYEPGIQVTYPDGSRRVDLVYESHRVLAAKPPLPGMPSVRRGESLEVTLSGRDLIVRLIYSVVPDRPALTRRVEVENRGKEPLVLERAYSVQFSLPGTGWEALSLNGAYGRETSLCRRKLSDGQLYLSSHRGSSSAVTNPSLVLLRPGAGEESGKAWGLTLMYSGSFAIRADQEPAGQLRVSAGIDEMDFSWELLPGAVFYTPEAILCFSREGVGGLSRAFHDVLRREVIPEKWANAPRPVVINNWEGTFFTFDEEKLRGIIDRAAGTGIDTFVLDDGWFGVRDDDSSGLGDWFVNEKKLPHGLKGLIDYAHGKGLRFGLWFEPEMVSRNSDLYRAHPDWAMEIPGTPGVTARKQLVLDLTREDVRENIAAQVNKILDEHEIDYLKWDCNRDLTEGFSRALPPHRQKEVFHRYILGVYDLLDRIVSTHPHIFFEGCSSGGARFDAGMLAYFPQIWVSDNTDAPARCRIQYGTGLVYPQSAQSCHVSASPGHYAAHAVPLASRAAIAQLGPTGYEMDLTKISPEDLAAFPDQIASYHRDEELILSGDLYRLFDPFTENVFGEEIAAKDGARARITLFRFACRYNESEKRVYPRGLLPDATYVCPELGLARRGDTWMEYGFLPVYPRGDYAAAVYHLERT